MDLILEGLVELEGLERSILGVRSLGAHCDFLRASKGEGPAEVTEPRQPNSGLNFTQGSLPRKTLPLSTFKPMDWPSGDAQSGGGVIIHPRMYSPVAVTLHSVNRSHPLSDCLHNKL